ncbi:hypothetical protein Elgi_37530 [Paenibacillus elgii]|uniref:hypothetical protein n=1 Tax=Paenibacillus elgii TaxID=189691 RepID=UPI002D7AE628|nr:hypothetical protein Elgi_37530 [Paenibacillus elgii]
MKDQLRLIAVKVRETIETIDPNLFPEECQLRNTFPNGACGDSSMLLGKLLLDNFDVDCDYVCGSSLLEGHEQETHAWLGYKGYKVDITADQFDQIKDKAIVEQSHFLYDDYGENSRKRISESFPDELISSYEIIKNRIYI